MIALNQAETAVDSRPKNFLTEGEIERFLKAMRKGRHASRNYTIALLAYRHGLRVSELINIRRADVDLDSGHLFVRRLKGSLSTSQPLEGMKFAPYEHGYVIGSTRLAVIRRWSFSPSGVQ